VDPADFIGDPGLRQSGRARLVEFRLYLTDLCRPVTTLKSGRRLRSATRDDLGVNTFISDLSVLSLSLLRRFGVNYRNGCVFSGSWRVQDSRIAERKRLYRYRVTFSSLFLLLGCIAITHCTDAAYCYKRSAAWVSLSVKANSHCHARHDKTVLSVSRPLGGVNWILDNSRQSPTENMKSEHVNSNCPIHIATPDRHRQDCFVVSDERCELGLSLSVGHTGELNQSICRLEC